MSAQIIPFPVVSRSHWTAFNDHCFAHLLADGMNAKDAAAHIEAEITDKRESELLPERDRPLFLARRALRRLPLKRS
ncbi:hypothetical protein [Rhodanobacter thiooxydans]|uniref:hypothetical protein n=1 Tax=Rhodanobacter thiooxydans TaxID=416169 RepID=UPI000D336E5F|nr:hypothetical protein [Rhodanobacter thiooxydans]